MGSVRKTENRILDPAPIDPTQSSLVCQRNPGALQFYLVKHLVLNQIKTHIDFLCVKEKRGGKNEAKELLLSARKHGAHLGDEVCHVSAFAVPWP